MKNPPDFVMYVVMVRRIGNKNFVPEWNHDGMIYGYRTKAQARPSMRDYQRIYGKENAYVQQYGPYS